MFAAWILNESLPWTTGEAPSLQLLFKYLKINFMLPSDTTVRNQLAKIFAELHGKVVREFSVSNKPATRLINNKILPLPECAVKDCVCGGYMDHQADGLYIRMHHRLLH